MGGNLRAAPPTDSASLDGQGLYLPQPDEYGLRILSRDTLELIRMNTKGYETTDRVTSWDFVDQNIFTPPSAGSLEVRVDGVLVPVANIGFKRRPWYAPLTPRDLRIQNSMELQLSVPIAPGQLVTVTSPDGTLWTADMTFSAQAEAGRFSPAIHVNQEGYTSTLPKKAMVGYYLGSLGELPVAPGTPFTVVDAASGAAAFSGSLTLRPDIGFTYSPTPYQQVGIADFSSLTTAGTYRLVVPGYGSSLPFRISPSMAMTFARTYALGLYEQRCGSALELPYTRHVHEACHTAPVEIPSPDSAYAASWELITGDNWAAKDNPRHTAPRLESEATCLYPFVHQGAIDVSGGHHDAGDYSKYTTDSAGLVHYLVFAADSLPGVGSLDNLGIPESGDGKSDLLQEARIEADFLAKMQDDDGGFYFLVYPKARRYEDNVLPDHGDSQVVWPKNTAASAAATAALAQIASSPLFKQQFPADAERYRLKALAGWQFLQNAIATYGKDGAYQQITHYGDIFMHDDELAWAACEIYLLTGDVAVRATLFSWYDPSSSDNRRWGWWRLFEGYGCACRSYAFAARSGRLPQTSLDAVYLQKCEQEILAAAVDVRSRSEKTAYGSAFEGESKRFQAAGWYFSSERAFDITVAQQIAPTAANLDAILT
ncbi:MAG: hypothetical protein JWO82_4298, partial [Akkermansiaceae bacterium]|nr:hypothetical protein [Akkermansiaceae bacterium]